MSDIHKIDRSGKPETVEMSVLRGMDTFSGKQLCQTVFASLLKRGLSLEANSFLLVLLSRDLGVHESRQEVTKYVVVPPVNNAVVGQRSSPQSCIAP